MEYQRTHLKTREVRTVEIVENVTADVQPWKYARKGQTWRPTSIRVHLISDRHDGGPWSPWTLSGGAKVLGHNIKADGSQGASRDEDHWDIRSSPFGPRVAEILAELNADRDPLPATQTDQVPVG